jgi:hypothetical protein
MKGVKCLTATLAESDDFPLLKAVPLIKFLGMDDVICSGATEPVREPLLWVVQFLGAVLISLLSFNAFISLLNRVQ